jgi:hypothetical protein
MGPETDIIGKRYYIPVGERMAEIEMRKPRRHRLNGTRKHSLKRRDTKTQEILCPDRHEE